MSNLWKTLTGGKRGPTKTEQKREGRKQSIHSSCSGGSATGLSDTSALEDANFRTPNEDAIFAYLEDVNRRAPVEELLKHFSSGDVPVLMEDSPPVNALFLLTEIRKVYLSFPDVEFKRESIKEVRPGEILVEEMEVTGTHTGEAYQFAHFPPVPTTHKHVVLDRERLWFTLKDGKIEKLEVVALGNLTGPPGMYISVGGKMEMPAP